LNDDCLFAAVGLVLPLVPGPGQDRQLRTVTKQACNASTGERSDRRARGARADTD
jgi:hypothetical protein